MGFLGWLRILIVLVGAGVAAYGCYVLVTGRPSERARAAFRSTRDAGMYPLCSGLGLVFLGLGQVAADADSLPIGVAFGALLLALVFGGLAFVRYRPRKNVS
ncbi:MAG: hypothetical protein ABW022_02550 [Actinoplanes sp.]